MKRYEFELRLYPTNAPPANRAGHVAFLVVLGALGWKLPEDLLSKSNEPLTKRSAPSSGPRRHSILTSCARVEEEGYVLQKPAAERMPDR